MNPNDIIAQQQALLNQVMQNAQQKQYAILAIYLALFILGALVTYMFYARLRDIGQELMKFRIAYEFAHTPEAQPRHRHENRREPSSPQPA